MSVIADLLQQKVGLSPDQAQQAEQVVVEHLTSRVPPEFQGVLDLCSARDQARTHLNQRPGIPAA